jgi:hypothetical protein
VTETRRDDQDDGAPRLDREKKRSGEADFCRREASWPRRTELHRQVWAEPMRTVAKKYGISDVALAKRCRKWGIPLPVQGHWNKGRHVSPPPV